MGVRAAIMSAVVPSHCLCLGISAYAVDSVGVWVIGLEPSPGDFLHVASATGFGPLADLSTAGESVQSPRRSFRRPRAWPRCPAEA